MNVEERLRDAFGQRAADVEVTPGALFEIQRRLARTRRLPELRLRPALVLAAAAGAAIAVVVSVSVTRTAPDPAGELVVPPVASPADPTEVAPPAGTTPTTAVLQQSADPAAPPPAGVQPPEPQTPEPQTPDPQTPEPQTPEQGSGRIATVSPAPPPPLDPPAPPPVDPPAPPPAGDDESDDESDMEPLSESVATAEVPVCPAEPAGSGGGGEATVFVTVYFACGASDAAPRQRAASVNNLATALDVLLSGPNEADAADGFRGLSGDSARTAAPTPDDRWLAIDLPADLADAFDAEVGVTAREFLTQLNATVFQFPEVATAEYRLDGDCAAFGALLDEPCQVYTRAGVGYASHTSELTAHTIGNAQSVIRAGPYDTADEVGLLADGTRLTARRATGANSTWAEIITPAGASGWVSVDTLVAQPLAISSDDINTMERLAKQLTTGPDLSSSAFKPGGLVVRWGADAGDIAVLPTADAGADRVWWNQVHNIPSPRDADATASPADLFWIDGGSDSAVVTINGPGPLGTPHSDFANLAYVSIYQGAVGRSTLPPQLAPTPTTTTVAVTTSDGVELPPPLPTGDGDPADSEGEPEPLRAQISVIFDFLSPDGPRIAAVEAIWIEP